MIIGILKDSGTEKRVAVLPGEIPALKKIGAEIFVEYNAGENAYAPDDAYRSAGAVIMSRNDIIKKASFLLSVNPPVDDKISLFNGGQVICSVLEPVKNCLWIEEARKNGITLLALDLVPRITRAQSMDVLSSMATISGYKAVLEAASLLPKFFPLFMSAAGTIKPSKVLILGAGVAGLQAVATARKLGAVVEVFDVRRAVKEEVRSLGGKFIEVEGSMEDNNAGGYAVEQTEEFKTRQNELIHRHSVLADVIISTALIPGKKAPILIKRETVMAMKHGSVIIDLAASSGGNCELTENGKKSVVNGVTIVGKSDYPSEMPSDASKMFGNNIISLIKILVDKSGNLILNMNDEIVTGAMVVHDKEYVSQRAIQMLNLK
jgi:H+-translocating NAD(P) transhydrogenase subunit alpha